MIIDGCVSRKGFDGEFGVCKVSAGNEIWILIVLSGVCFE